MTIEELAKLTPEEKKLRIAKICGVEPVYTTIDAGGFKPKPWAVWPDYLNDLNAMHEAEKALLTSGLLRGTYQERLTEIAYDNEKRSGSFYLVNATAPQRADALLLTVG